MSEIIGDSIILRAIGWGLLQSLWQGALVGATVFLALAALKERAAVQRYLVACIGLLMVAVLPAMSAVRYARTAGDTTRSSAPHALTAESLSRTSAAERRLGGAADDIRSAGAATLPTLGQSESRWNQRLEPWAPFAVSAWLVGVLLCSLRLARHWIVAQRLKQHTHTLPPGMWTMTVARIASRLGVERRLNIAASAVITVPMVIGWLRPVLLLPASALSGLTLSQIEAIVAHELAHVRRHDYLVNVAQSVAETLFFYHPVVWWLSHRIRVEREHCCDDIAVEVCGDRLKYATALVELETLRGSHVTLGLALTDGSLLRRIRRLVAPVPPRERSAPLLAVASVLAALTIGLVRENVGGQVTQVTDGAQAQSVADPNQSGVVRGRVVDEATGKPIAGADLELSEQGRVTTATTDADGYFETKVPPGSLDVFVEANGYVSGLYDEREPGAGGVAVDVQAGKRASDVDLFLKRAGTISGQVFGADGAGVPGVEIRALRLANSGIYFGQPGLGQTDEWGRFRMPGLRPGEFYVYASLPDRVQPAPASRPGEFYGLTFHPGVTSIYDAQPVLVGPGQQVSNVTFALTAVQARSLSGVLIDPVDQDFAGASVMVLGEIGRMEKVAVAADGSFRARDLLPGQYHLMVEHPRRAWAWLGAMTDVTIDEDVSGIELVAKRGDLVNGRVLRAGGGQLPFSPTSLQVGSQLQMDALGMHMAFMRGTAVSPDGTFTIENLAGRARLQIPKLPSPWSIKSVHLNGADVTDKPFDFGAGKTHEAVITVTDSAASFSGRVVDQSGRPASNDIVVVFPADREKWGGESRVVQATRTQPDGSYRFEGLPAGDYLAIALVSLPWKSWTRPDVLELIQPSATTFRLDDGERQVLRLRQSAMPSGLSGLY